MSVASPVAEEFSLWLPTSAFSRSGFRDWRDAGGVSDGFQVDRQAGGLVIETETPVGLRSVHLPDTVRTLSGFCEWAISSAFPVFGRFTFLDQEIHVDMSPEEIQTHINIKAEVNRQFANLARRLKLGTYFPDGTLIRNDPAGLANEPDCTFVLHDSMRSGKVRLQPRKGYPGEDMALVGSPDIVVEIVSRSSWTKDTCELVEKYHAAGIAEYWLIDGLDDKLEFRLLRWRKGGYVAAPARQGWRKSHVLDRWFRLTRKQDIDGLWQYTLGVRS